MKQTTEIIIQAFGMVERCKICSRIVVRLKYSKRTGRPIMKGLLKPERDHVKEVELRGKHESI